MTVNRGLYVPLNGDLGTTPVEARLAMAGMVAENAPGVPRQGLLFQSAASVVQGTSGMQYAISPCHPVVTRGADDGVYIFTLTGTTLVNTTVAPGSGSRWDLIFVKQNDTTKGDADNLPVVGVVQGVASSTPAKPYASVPSGAYVLAEAQVNAGALTTNGAGVTITQMWRHTAMRGAAIPVRNTTERNEITGFTGAKVTRLDYRGMEQVFTGSGWYGSMSQSGVASVPYVANGGSTGQVTVTFPVPFPGVPRVSMNPPSSRETSSIVSTTATNFIYTIDNRSGGGAAAGNLFYVATFGLT